MLSSHPLMSLKEQLVEWRKFMGDQFSEDYLDQLLNSMNREVTKEKGGGKPKEEKPENAFVREMFGEPDSEEALMAKNEEDFLREFEEELLQGDIPDYMESFEQDFSDFSSPGQKKKDQEVAASIADMLDHMPQSSQADFFDENVSVDEDAEFAGELPEQPKKEKMTKEELMKAMRPEEDENLGNLDTAVDAFDEGLAGADGTGQGTDEPLPVLDGGELDLSGMGDRDLMDMLSGNQSLSDLGDLLSGNADNASVDEGDPIGKFAEAEMAAQEKEQEKNNPKGADKEHKKKKPGGFWAKISKVIFGDDEEEKVVIGDVSDVDVAGLSEENQQILRELEVSGGVSGTDSGKKKDKKKKDKKASKPKKEPKAKAPKKPKKPKKPKEKDNTPPLPKGPVLAIIVMVASLFGLVLLVTSLLGYQAKISAAKADYDKEAYVEAYRNLQGLEIKSKDEEFYNKLATLAAVSEKYQSYLVFDNYGSKDLALDSLVCAYGRYDLNKQYAEEYGCEGELENIGGKILKALLKEYDMTGEEALELYKLKNRDDYTVQLRKKLQELGLQ